MVSGIGKPSAKVAYIFGEAGLGKTRLVEKVTSTLNGQFRYLAIPELPQGQYIDLLPDLRSMASDTTLLVLDDVDHAILGHPQAARDTLQRRGNPSVYATAASTDLHRSWHEFFGQPDSYIRLRPFDFRECREMLASVGILGRQAHLLLGESEGNPGRLLALAEIEDPGTLVDPEQLALATILGPDGGAIAPGDRGFEDLELAVNDISEQLIRLLAEKPELMYELSWRKFEETVADLYRREGYDVELTRGSKDGGVDFFAWQKTPYGRSLTVVDCKRYRKDRPIEVDLVRSLYGTAEARRASVGVIATTSYFTSGARSFQEERQHRIGLQDFISLQEMLEKAAREAPARAAQQVESE